MHPPANPTECYAELISRDGVFGVRVTAAEKQSADAIFRSGPVPIEFTSDLRGELKNIVPESSLTHEQAIEEFRKRLDTVLSFYSNK